MSRLLQFAFLIGGIFLLVMTAAVALTRRNEPLRWMIYEDENFVYWLQPDSGNERQLFASPDVYQSNQWTIHDQQFYFVMWTPASGLPHLFRVNLYGQHLTQLSHEILQGIDTFWIIQDKYLVVQTIEDHFKPSELYIMNLSETPLRWRNVSQTPSTSDYYWALSPDGNWLYYSTRISDVSESWDISRIRLDGTEQEFLASIPYYGQFIDWSPDGDWAWLLLNVDRYMKLFRVSIDGDVLEPLSDLSIGRIVGWSGNQHWFIFTAHDGSKWGIYRLATEGSELTNLTISLHYNNNIPRLSPDGTSLMVSTCELFECTSDVIQINIEDGSITPLIENEFDEYFVNWSPNGNQILYFRSFENAYGFQRQYFIADSDAKNAVVLTPDDNFAIFVDWSPDGERLIYSAVTANRSRDLYWVRKNGSDHQQLTDNKSEVRFQTWSPPFDVAWHSTQSLLEGLSFLISGLVIARLHRSDKDKRLAMP